MCVLLSSLFPEISSGLLGAVAVVSPGFGHLSKQAFSCLIAFRHPSPVVGSQVGKQYLDSRATYSPKVLRHHRNWALRGGETRGVPPGTGKTSAGFSKDADLGIIRTPFLQLAPRTSGTAHSHTHVGR